MFHKHISNLPDCSYVNNLIITQFHLEHGLFLLTKKVALLGGRPVSKSIACCTQESLGHL